MTGGFGSMPGFDALLAQANRAREAAEKAKRDLAEKRVEGRAGGGMVVATCDGAGELVRVRFEPGLLAKEEASVVEDLVVAAVRDARRRAQDAQKEAYASLGALGGGLSSMLGPAGMGGLLDLLGGSGPSGPSAPPGAGSGRKPPS